MVGRDSLSNYQPWRQSRRSTHPGMLIGAEVLHMTLLELNLIGVPEVILDGEPVTFARRGSIALLAYLALSRRAYPRESLATLLAGDSSEDQARKHLSNVLVDLRQRLN